MLASGRDRVADASLDQRIDLVEAHAEALPLDSGQVDGLTHTYLLRYVDDPAATLRELARVIRPGGVMASLDFGVPAGPAFHAWRVWTRAGLPTAGRLAGPGWVDTGRFLGPNIEQFWREHPLPAVLEMWRSAGMEEIRAQRLSLGGGIVIWGRRADA
jgi:demethylmenaquinone methyltransferase / 2-methoxy-6-polyprenyl-1,4-benzoquinol methylase